MVTIMQQSDFWPRFQENFFLDRASGFALDISRMLYPPDFFENHNRMFVSALESMRALEGGAIANPDEKRMVGHYWLRDSTLAPTDEIRREIVEALSAIKNFASSVHSGKIVSPSGSPFKFLLVIGIGGSALGPQFVSRALGGAQDPIRPFFFDNTDPDGMEFALSAVPDLGRTLCVVISKSGGTKETRNGQIVARRAFEEAGLDYSRHFVAVTSSGSDLDKQAVSEKWLARFPMWDWVGGRTSELSAVGLLPAALQGIGVDDLLAGAAHMDRLTRAHDVRKNPALCLAAMWYHAGQGKGLKDMVILPYKDRLELFSRYLQQLVMESLGKELDLEGRTVNQGIAVYGNKGSTDQHAYVQQLRDGLNNFFVTFLTVEKDLSSKAGGGDEQRACLTETETGVSSGDFLFGFYHGTRSALSERNRESLTISVREINEFSIGMLIALFERAVGFYASFVNINAYHQPGVEAGKKAAASVLNLQVQVTKFLNSRRGEYFDCTQIASELGKPNEAEIVFAIMRRLAANEKLRVSPADNPFEDRFGKI